MLVPDKCQKEPRKYKLNGKELLICGNTTPDVLQSLAIDLQLKAFRPALRQKKALIGISQLPEGRVVTAQLDGKIVGYVTFHPPDSFERWSLGPMQVLELGAIEVAPQVRNYGVAKKMLEVAFEDPLMENYIVFSTEYYWHWDFEGTGLEIWEYREMMRKIMEHVGMEIRDTDEEEIASHPANMLMVRIGANVDKAIAEEFEKLLFLDS